MLGEDRDGKKSLWLVIAFAVVMRALVSSSYYSGENLPPKFGDFECHRHWMELTHHAPVHTWYTDGPLMNYTYWPMDYPPLCAYTHWFWSQIIAVVQPDAIKLQGSYGYSSQTYRATMRAILIVAEMLVFVPAAIMVIRSLYPKQSKTT